MDEIRLSEIENGYTIHSTGKTTFCKTKEEVIEKVKDMMGIEKIMGLPIENRV